MELREPPPGGREVQVLLGSCSPAGLSLGPFPPKAALSRQEARVGGWPAGLPVDSHSRLVLQPCRCLSPSEAGSGSKGSGRQLQPRGWICRGCPWPPSPACRGSSGWCCWLSLSLSLSLSFLSLCSSHITWASVLWGLRHLFQYVLGPPELSRGC